MSQRVRSWAIAITFFALLAPSAPAIGQTSRASLEKRVATLESLVSTQRAHVVRLHDQVLKLLQLVAAHHRVIEDQQAKLACMSMAGDEVFFTGCNVRIVNGMGGTATINGVGNLIVGYDEISYSTKTGSHNLVVGPGHSYTSYGGLVAGQRNIISGEYAAVTGGAENFASAKGSSVSGGLVNHARGDYSSVSGGHENGADGRFSSVSGGFMNGAHGEHTSVSGGQGNTAVGPRASVSGGFSNSASGSYSTVSSGAFNSAGGQASSVSGGLQRVAPNASNWAAGSLLENN